jgi:multidrug transporter EmrE-like cation transporter
MLYLILAIICSASIALIFKYSETSGMNRYAVTSANYLAACIIGLITILINGLPLPESLRVSDQLAEIGHSLFNNGSTLSLPASMVWAVMVGLFAGLLFFLGFIYYQVSVRRHGVSLAGSFAKLGILVPMALSLVIWKEYPSTLQWVGIGLAIASILLANWPTQGSYKKALKIALILLFLFGGISEFCNKIFQKYALLEYKSLFLLVTFFTAFLFSVAAMILKNRKLAARDLITGFIVGIPNLFSAFFLILALDKIKATVVFPVYGAGTIVIISLVGIFFFREKPNLKERLAIVLTILTLILINI